MNSLEKLFNEKLTENGDISYKSTGNDMLDFLFMSAFFEKHLKQVYKKVGTGEKWRLFAMFMRDPRLGLGRRDLGRYLMYYTKVLPENVPKCGRYDDLLEMGKYREEYLEQIVNDGLGKGIYLAKKWLPRLNSKNRDIAQYICTSYGISEKKYRRRIKLDTTENLLSRQRTDEIDFEKVPSLAMLKYYNRFLRGEDTSYRFQEYLEKVNAVRQDEQEIKENIKGLEEELSACMKKVGLVRYNAFKDTGSDLSFALAILDGNNNGVILNGIYSREISNIYAKKITQGNAVNKLSEEEEQALKQAMMM